MAAVTTSSVLQSSTAARGVALAGSLPQSSNQHQQSQSIDQNSIFEQKDASSNPKKRITNNMKNYKYGSYAFVFGQVQGKNNVMKTDWNAGLRARKKEMEFMQLPYTGGRRLFSKRAQRRQQKTKERVQQYNRQSAADSDEKDECKDDIKIDAANNVPIAPLTFKSNNNNKLSDEIEAYCNYLNDIELRTKHTALPKLDKTQHISLPDIYKDLFSNDDKILEKAAQKWGDFIYAPLNLNNKGKNKIIFENIFWPQRYDNEFHFEELLSHLPDNQLLHELTKEDIFTYKVFMYRHGSSIVENKDKNNAYHQCPT